MVGWYVSFNCAMRAFEWIVQIFTELIFRWFCTKWHFYEKNDIFWYFYENFGNFEIVQKQLLRIHFEPRFHGSIALCLGFIFQKARVETNKYSSIPGHFLKIGGRFKIGHWFDILPKNCRKNMFFLQFLKILINSIPFQKVTTNRSIFARFESRFLEYQDMT